VTANTKEAKITILDIPDKPGQAARILKGIYGRNITVDMIIMNASSRANHADMTFTVMKTDLKDALVTVNGIAREVGASGVVHDEKIAKLSVVGLGMRCHSGVARKMFAALAGEGINIQTVSTSEIKVSCLIPADEAARGVRAVHRAFQLEKASPSPDPEIRHISTLDQAADRRELTELLNDEVRNLKGMEDIVVLTAEANRQEAKVTILAVPDRPGVASDILKAFAERGISLNIILQNVSRQGVTDFTMTVLRDDLAAAVEAARLAQKRVGGRDVMTDDHIATLSIDGVGMRSHTGVGTKMFAALADAGVNIQMISTSEIKISCVIDERDADRALAAVKKAFELD
jgi:aspartate kinase